jgi:drug/metabolite transporter (DMT)-like permease
MDRSQLLIRLAPALFVLLWSTGWISARAAAPYADPLTFLTLRYLFAAAALLVVARAMGAVWPTTAREVGHGLVSGVLLHALYLGGVWWAIRNGMPTAVSGVIAAIQPILTAMLAPRLAGESISRTQWIGIALGFAGMALVLQPKLAEVEAGVLATIAVPLLVNVAGMVGVTLGTFYQKRFIAVGDLRTMTLIQYLGAALVTAPLAFALEPMQIVWNVQIVATMIWAVVGLSIGAIGLWLMLIRRGAVSRAAALVYLVPPTVAVEAMILFGESLGAIQLLGMLVAAAGVALAVRR